MRKIRLAKKPCYALTECKESMSDLVPDKKELAGDVFLHTIWAMALGGTPMVPSKVYITSQS